MGDTSHTHECCGHHEHEDGCCGHHHGEGCGHHHNHEEGCCGHHHHGHEDGCCEHHHGHEEGCCGKGCGHHHDQIGIFRVGPLETNCYIYVSGNECMVVDPGASGSEIALQLHDLNLKYIVATHGHADHVGGVKALKLAAGGTYRINQKDAERACHAAEHDAAYDNAPQPDGFLAEGDTLEFGTALFHVMETPGHTPGGICLVGDGTAKGAVFVGDTLFKGSVGRTDLDGGDLEALTRSLQRLKCELDPTSLILSGHGEQTEFAQELKENPFLA